jgi:pimeloyl-ACP methyl ester carboxylesterase
LSCYAAGPKQGVPLLLVHSVNATGSAAEVRPLHEHFSASRPVYSLDLPGFAFSERSDRAYTPRLMTDALHAVAAQMAVRHGHAPIHALAVSLACEFLARAAAEAPARFGKLALVSPTGFSGSRRRRGPPGSTLAVPWLHRLLANPAWGGGLFRQLTRPGVVRYFLQKTFGAKQIDEEMWRYAVATARQPGAEHAPLHFLSAGLFSKDINNVYEQLTQPVWMSHGTRGDFVDYRGKSTVQGLANWRFTVYEAGALPYFEQPAVFCAALQSFLQDA